MCLQLQVLVYHLSQQFCIALYKIFLLFYYLIKIPASALSLQPQLIRYLRLKQLPLFDIVVKVLKLLLNKRALRLLIPLPYQLHNICFAIPHDTVGFFEFFDVDLLELEGRLLPFLHLLPRILLHLSGPTPSFPPSIHRVPSAVICCIQILVGQVIWLYKKLGCVPGTPPVWQRKQALLMLRVDFKFV